MMKRRGFCAVAMTGAAGAAYGAPEKAELASKLAAAMASRVVKKELVREAVILESVDLLRIGKNYLVRARAKNGAVGYSEAHSVVMAAAYPILVK